MIEAIGYKTGDKRYDRLALRVHEAPLGVVLAHRDLRRVPHVHAHRSVSEVHQLPDERVLADVSPVRAALLPRGFLPLRLLLRLGEVPSPGAPWSGARPQRRGHGHHVDRQCLAHVHDVAGRDLGHRGGHLRRGRDLRTTPGCRSTCIGSSRTSPSADRSQPPTRPSSSCRRRPTRSARITTGWDTSGTSSPSSPSSRFPSPATGSRRRSTPTRRRSGSR